jgi:hypothetical protein
VKGYIYQRLWEILSSQGTGKDDPHLGPEDRAAIVETLRETKRDLPNDWNGSTASPADHGSADKRIQTWIRDQITV